jgi:hypothetical protein
LLSLAKEGIDEWKREKSPVRIYTMVEEEGDQSEEKPVDIFTTTSEDIKTEISEIVVEIPGSTIEADAFGLIEAAVVGGNAEFLAITEGAWEGIDVVAPSKGAAEGEIPNQLVQDITTPADLEIFGETIETEITISEIEIGLETWTASRKRKRQPRYVYVSGGITDVHRTLH